MDNFQIETAQNVNIFHNVAGVGERIVAFLIDGLLIFAYYILVSFVFSNFSIADENYFMVAMVMGLPPFVYHLLWETFWDGRSPGKAVMKLRVVKIDGSKPVFSSFLLRWLLRLVDITACFGSVALFTILFNGKGQRLGDLAATTTVITEKKTITFSQTILAEVPTDYTPTYQGVTIFKDSEMQTIKNVYQDAKRKGNHKVINSLSTKVATVMKITPEQTPIKFLDVVIKDYNFYTQHM